MASSSASSAARSAPSDPRWTPSRTPPWPWISTAPTVAAGRSSGGPAARIAWVFSLLSVTFGWSNGLIPRIRPVIAVAYSHPRNCAPSGPTTPTDGPGSGAGAPTTASSASGVCAPGACTDSSATGRMPRPSLPVDSAISCSAQSPKPRMGVSDSASTMPTLSRPVRKPAPSATLSSRAALPGSARCSASVSASVSSSPTSAPASALGTSPNADRALYRPPTVGSARNTAWAPMAAADSASGEPGSVTTTNRAPISFSSNPASAKAEMNARRWLSVSTVPPDFELTTTTVRSRSVMARATWPGSVVSRTTRGTPAVRQMTSGASDEPPMPQSTIRSRPREVSSARSSASPETSSRELAGRSSQPSRIAASLSASGPHRVASFWTSRGATSSSRSWFRTVSGTSSPLALTSRVTGTPCRRPSAFCGSPRPWMSARARPSLVPLVLELAAHRLGQLVPGVDELLHALLLEHAEDVVEVDAGVCYRLHHGRGVVVGLLDRGTGLPVVRVGLQRLLRHRVHGAGGDELGDVHRVRVLGVLDARRRPQRPLRARPPGLQRPPPVGGEDLLVGLVGQPRIGDARLALERRVGAGLVQPLVDLGVDAGHEERRDGRDAVQRAPLLEALFQSRQVCVHDRPVALETEDEGDVDTDAAGDGRRDRRQARLGRRNLDVQVRPVDQPPQVRGLGGGRVRLVRQAGRDLEGDPAVTGGPLGDRGEQVTGVADVGCGDRAQCLLDAHLAHREGVQPVVVGLRSADRRGEDGGVRGDPDDRVLVDEGLQVASADAVPRQVVQPDGDPCFGQLGQLLVLCHGPGAFRTRWGRRSGHRSPVGWGRPPVAAIGPAGTASPDRAASRLSRAAATTASSVRPNSSYRTL